MYLVSSFSKKNYEINLVLILKIKRKMNCPELCGRHKKTYGGTNVRPTWINEI